MPTADRFLADVLRNPANQAILDLWDALEMPDGWLVAGCLFQAVWNARTGAPAAAQVKDYDLFYFDPHDLGSLAEQRVQARVDAATAGLGITVEAKNQARVHLWYQDFFGYPYSALHSASDGIARFLVLETCVGIRPGAHGPQVHAPYGLAGLYAGTLSPNPLVDHRPLFERKARSYQSRWPWLGTCAAAHPVV